MDWSEWRSSAGFAANMTSLAFRFAEQFKGKPSPELLLDEVKAMGGGDGIVRFGVVTSEIGNKVPAIGVHLFAELHEIGVVYEAPPFKIGAGELDHRLMFTLERPKYGTLVKECNDQQTLYGRTRRRSAARQSGHCDLSPKERGFRPH